MTTDSKGIRTEADGILRSGLLSILGRHGEVHIVGTSWVLLGNLLGDERSGAWKIDIWRTQRQAFELVRRVGDDLSARLNDTNRAVILAIKAACWRDPQYRRGFTSADVYAAVLDRGVRDVPGFWADLHETKGIDLHSEVRK